MAPPELANDDRERITDLLLQIRGGSPDAMDRLYHAVYGRLRQIASRYLRGEQPGHTLGTTGLLHETYLKLADQTRVQWQDRAHFYRVASQAMRRILVNYARLYRGAGERIPQKELVDRSLWAFDQALAGNPKKAGEVLAEFEEECVLQVGCNHRVPHRAVQRLAAAQWLQAAGDLERARRLMRYQDEPQRGWDWIIRDALAGPTYLSRGRIEEAVGHDSLAQEYYTQFLRRYDRPISSQMHIVQEAKAALARLASQRDR